MRFVSRLNLCLLLLRVVSARNIISVRAGLPNCVQTCFPTAVQASGCPANNAPCICDSQTFYESLLPCVLINCGYADVSGLLNYGLEFCQRTGVNSAQRLGGVGKSASGGGGDDDASVSTSATPVEPTSAPEPEPISSEDPIPPVVSSTVAPPIVDDTTAIESTAPPAPTTFIVVSTTAPISVTEIASSTLEISLSSTSIEVPPEVESTSIPVPTPTTRSRTPSLQFTVESTSQKDDTNTEPVVIQTADPISSSRNTQAAATTALESTSAPPTPTVDAPSSAAASALHMFGQSSFNSFILCLVALFFVF
ncbi:hypothetical protein TWF281_009773 [Arthrobotrys megalospora]